MGRITVFGGPERRRRWSTEEQQRILEEAFAPGACVSQVARRHDVSTALVYTWRRKLSAALVASQEDHGFIEAVVLEDKSSVPTPGQPAIMVELSHGARVVITQGVGRKRLHGGRMPDSPCACRHRRFMS